jgi:hypothetical protein
MSELIGFFIVVIIIGIILALSSKKTEHFAGYGGLWDSISKPFKSVGKAVSGGLGKIKSTINGIVNKVKDIARKIARLPQKVADKIKGVVTKIIRTVKDKIIGGIRKLWEGIAKAFGKIWKGIKKIFDKIKGAFVKLWKGIKGGFTKMWDGIKKIFKKLGGFFKKLWAGIKKAFLKIWAGIKKVFKKIKAFLSKMIKAISKWFKQFWGKIKTFFKKLWAILTDPFGWFMGIFAKIVKSIMGNVGGAANKAIWSFADPKNRPWYRRHSTKIFIGVAILSGGIIFGINYGIKYFMNKDLCVDPKTGEVIEDNLEHPIKLKDRDCPYNIPEGMCQDPETLTVLKNEFDEMISADSPECKSSTFDQDGGITETQKLADEATAANAAIPQPPAPSSMQDAIVQAQDTPLQTTTNAPPTNNAEATSDFRAKLQNKSGGRKRRTRKNRKRNKNIIKQYTKYLNL